MISISPWQTWALKPFNMKPLAPNQNLRVHPLVETLNLLNVLATLCTAKGFQYDHYPLNFHCGVAKLSSPDILKLISDNKVCPSCICPHDPAIQCRLLFHNGQSKVCPKGSQHDGFPVHRRACMHSNHTPTISVSKVGLRQVNPLGGEHPRGSCVSGNPVRHRQST